MAEEAIKKIKIAIENDTEVYLSRVEQLEGSLDKTTNHYSALLASTDEIEVKCDQFANAKQVLEKLLENVDKLEQSVNQLDLIAEELEQYSLQLIMRS